MPAPPAGVNVAVGEVVLLNCVESVEGLPGNAVQAPVPGLAELAAKAPPVTQMVLSGPALATAAGAFTVITTWSVELVHGLLADVHVSV